MKIKSKISKYLQFYKVESIFSLQELLFTKISIALLLLINNIPKDIPNYNIKETIFSLNTVNLININLRIQNYYFLFICIFIFFQFVNLFINLILNNIKNRQNITKSLVLIEGISILTFVQIFNSLLNNLQQISEKRYFNPTLTFLIISIFLLIIHLLLNTFINYKFESFKLNLTIVYISTIFLSLLNIFNFFKNNNEYYILIFFLLNLLVIKMITSQKNINISEYFYKNKYILLIFPLALSVGIELINILNFNNFNILSKKHYTIICFLIVIITYLLSVKYKLKENLLSNNQTLVTLIGFLFLSLSPNYKLKLNNIIMFETANYANSIYEFFHFNKIPIIETFDAHMLSTTIWGIIYGFISRDTNGAIFSPYLFMSYVVGFAILFKILENFMDKLFAFLFTLLLPIKQSFLPYYDAYLNTTYSINFSLLPIIFLIYLLRNNSLKNFIILWFTIMLSIFYKLDTGIPYSVATIIIIFIEIGNNKILRSLFYKSFGIFSIINIPIFILIFWFKNINFPIRIREIVDIVSSNQLWGTPTLGITPENTYFYLFSHILAPLLVTVLSFKIFLKILKVKNLPEKINLYLTLLFGISYLINVQRIFVRHNLNQGFPVGIIIFNLLIFFSLYFYQNYKINNSLTFIKTYIITYFLITILIPITNYKIEKTSIDIFINKIQNPTEITVNRIGERVILDSNYNNDVKNLAPIKKIISKPFTFLNFSTNSLLYPLLELPNPSYINQFPLLLNTHISQDIFINNAKSNKNIKYVITNDYCSGIDQQNFNILFYKVSDYINRNYEPRYKINDYVIWEKIYNSQSNPLLNNSYSRIYPSCYDKFIVNLGNTPYIFNKNYKLQNPEVVYNYYFNDKNEVFDIENKVKIDKKFNYFILLELNSIKNSPIELKLLANKSALNSSDYLSLYTFYTRESHENEKYLIPISSDFNWFREDFRYISLHRISNYSGNIILSIIREQNE